MDTLLALIVHERDREAVRAAVPGWVAVNFIARVADLRQPWPEGEPAAVLAELADAAGISPALALRALHRRASAIPVCAYVPLNADAVRKVVRLAVRRIVTDVISVPDDDLRARLHHLLRRARVRDETAALRRVWRPWTPLDVRDIVNACIALSGAAASVGDVARQLNRSPRTLNRQLARAGLPSARRLLGWCRLLRGAYRLARPGASVKTVSAELRYASPHAFVLHLQRQAALTVTDLRTGGFRGLAAHMEAELLTTRAHAIPHVRQVAAR